LSEDEFLIYRGIIYVLNVQELKNILLIEIHKVPYDGHLDYRKTIVVVKNQHYFPIMKKEVVYFIFKCLEYQKVKAERRHPTGFL